MPTIAVTIVDQTVAVTQVGEIGLTGATGPTGTVSAAGDGTAGAPGIAFASDTNTGFWRPSADILAASTGGTERVRLDASGNVGIGCTPSAFARFQASLATDRRFTAFANGADNAVGYLDDAGNWISTLVSGSPVRLGAGGSEAMRIISGGNVGIGTNNPLQKLVVSSGANGFEFVPGATASLSTLQVYDRVAGSYGGLTVDAATFDFRPSGSSAMRIDASGYVTPGADNTQNFGSGSLRWATIFAGTGTINTSDERYKVLREGGDLSDAEHRAWSAVRAIVYRDKDSFERKGDAARLHIGYSWQSIQAAFKAEGLDPARYGLWCEDVLEAPVEKTRTATRPVEGQTETVPVLDDDGQPVFEQVQETEDVEQPFEEVRMIDGAPVLVKGVRTVAQPVFDSVQIRDEDGELVFTDPDPETGEPIPRMAPVPRMITRAKTETVPVMEEVEETYTEMEPTGETRGALRYSQCSVIEAAWLRRELASLTARVSALEAV